MVRDGQVVPGVVIERELCVVQEVDGAVGGQVCTSGFVAAVYSA
jgi:hypothetical protein